MAPFPFFSRQSPPDPPPQSPPNPPSEPPAQPPSASSSDRSSDHEALEQAIQQDIRQGRKFSLADAIGQEAGDFMKGVSPVPPLVQAELQVARFIRDHLPDSSGALQTALVRWMESGNTSLSAHLDDPLTALVEQLDYLLTNPAAFYELVRQADVLWGQQYDERPYFQQPGQPAHPEDEYSHDSVRAALAQLVVAAQQGELGPEQTG